MVVRRLWWGKEKLKWQVRVLYIYDQVGLGKHDPWFSNLVTLLILIFFQSLTQPNPKLNLTQPNSKPNLTQSNPYNLGWVIRVGRIIEFFKHP